MKRPLIAVATLAFLAIPATSALAEEGGPEPYYTVITSPPHVVTDEPIVPGTGPAVPLGTAPPVSLPNILTDDYCTPAGTRERSVLPCTYGDPEPPGITTPPVTAGPVVVYAPARSIAAPNPQRTARVAPQPVLWAVAVGGTLGTVA